jgi:hypothetical protein
MSGGIICPRMLKISLPQTGIEESCSGIVFVILVCCTIMFVKDFLSVLVINRERVDVRCSARLLGRLAAATLRRRILSLRRLLHLR